MKPSPPHTNPLPLDGFLTLLEAEGFEVGTGTRLKIMVLLRGVGKGRPLHELGPLLAPALVKNPKQQERFDRAWKNYFEEAEGWASAQMASRSQDTKTVDLPEGAEKDKKAHLQKDKNRKVRILVGAHLLLAVVMAAVAAWLFRSPQVPVFTLNTPADTVLVGESLTVTAAGLSDISPKWKWRWNDGNGNISEKTDSIFTLSYPQKGSFTVSLTLYDPGNNEQRRTAQQLLTVLCPENQDFQPAFGISNLTPVAGETVLFADSTENPSGKPLYYRWQGRGWLLPDAVQTDLPQLAHAFPEEGNFTLRLTVSTDSTFTDACAQKSVDRHLAVASEKTPVELVADFPLQRDGQPQQLIAISGWAKVLLALLLIGAWSILETALYFARRTSRPESIKRLLSTSDKSPISIPYPSQEHHLEAEKEFFELATGMRKRLEGQATRLDVALTIAATAKRGGFPDFQYQQLTRPPEYLVLVQQGGPDNHLLRLFRLLTLLLEGEDLHLEPFTFTHDPRRCRDAHTGERFTLEELAQRFPEHRLLIFTDGYRLLHPKFPRLHEWVREAFRPWQERALLTPIPAADWGYREDLLRGEFRLLPADLHALLEVLQPILAEEQPSLEQLKKQLNNGEYLKKQDFHTAKGLQHYLKDERLFEWLCAAATFPTPTWELTLAIGQKLHENERVMVSYGNLLKLSRIPWLQDGTLGDGLRKQLLNHLDPEVEKLARKAILEILSQAEVPENSFAYEERESLNITNRFLLKPDDPHHAKEMYWLWKAGMLTDGPLRERLQEAEKTLAGDKPLQQLEEKYRRFRPAEVVARFSLVILLLLLFGWWAKRYENTPTLQQWNASFGLQDRGLAEAAPLDSAVYWNNLAVDTAENALDIEVADYLLEKALNLRPDYALAQNNRWHNHLNLGTFYYWEEDFGSAIEQFNLAENAEADSLRLYALHGAGAAHYLQDDSDSIARSYLAQILATDSSFFERVPSPNLQEVLTPLLAEGELGTQLGGTSIDPSLPKVYVYFIHNLQSESQLFAWWEEVPNSMLGKLEPEQVYEIARAENGRNIAIRHTERSMALADIPIRDAQGIFEWEDPNLSQTLQTFFAKQQLAMVQFHEIRNPHFESGSDQFDTRFETAAISPQQQQVFTASTEILVGNAPDLDAWEPLVELLNRSDNLQLLMTAHTDAFEAVDAYDPKILADGRNGAVVRRIGNLGLDEKSWKRCVFTDEYPINSSENDAECRNPYNRRVEFKVLYYRRPNFEAEWACQPSENFIRNYVKEKCTAGGSEQLPADKTGVRVPVKISSSSQRDAREKIKFITDRYPVVWDSMRVWNGWSDVNSAIRARELIIGQALKNLNGETLRTEGLTPNDLPTIERVLNDSGFTPFNMVRVAGGTFTMGCTEEQGGDCEDNERPAREVTLSSYWVGQTEVTNQQFAEFLNDYGTDIVKSGEYDGKLMIEPDERFGLVKIRQEIPTGQQQQQQQGGGQTGVRTVERWQPAKGRENHPVVQVSWFGAHEYCRWLSAKTGQRFRLLTEAEWEYAARGGQLAQPTRYAGTNNIDEAAWYDGNAGRQTQPVAQKMPNELGLYDMTGNVWEWCSDWFNEQYYAQSAKITDPQGAKKGNYRTVRSGSLLSRASDCRLTHRFRYLPYDHLFNNGFRLCRD